jgi:hypothetical protein
VLIEEEGRGRALAKRIADARADIEASTERLAASRSQLAQTRQELSAGRDARQSMHDSAYIRLAARLESQPVIEQAKGILMAQTGCGPDEAFDLLRAASQQANIKVRDLAADIVKGAASDGRRSRSARTS